MNITTLAGPYPPYSWIPIFFKLLKVHSSLTISSAISLSLFTCTEGPRAKGMKSMVGLGIHMPASFSHPLALARTEVLQKPMREGCKVQHTILNAILASLIHSLTHSLTYSLTHLQVDTCSNAAVAGKGELAQPLSVSSSISPDSAR